MFRFHHTLQSRLLLQFMQPLGSFQGSLVSKASTPEGLNSLPPSHKSLLGLRRADPISR